MIRELKRVLVPVALLGLMLTLVAGCCRHSHRGHHSDPPASHPLLVLDPDER